MKTIKTLLITLFLASSWMAYGQQDWSITSSSKSKIKTNSIHVSLYVEAGAGLSFYHSTDKSDETDFSSAVGIVLGGGANVCFLDKVFLDEDKLAGQVGLSFANAGFSSDGEKVRGNYLCVPLSIQYYPVSNFYAELVLQPCLNIGLSPSVAYIGELINLEDHKANDCKIGLGVGYVLDAIPLGFSARYLFGTSDFAENLPWRGNQLSVCVFWRFGL